MSEANSIETLVKQDYKYGFVTDIESESAPPGLNEDIIRLISSKKEEPEEDEDEDEDEAGEVDAEEKERKRAARAAAAAAAADGAPPPPQRAPLMVVCADVHVPSVMERKGRPSCQR